MVSPARAAVVAVTRGLDPRVHLLRKEMDCIGTRACPRSAVLAAPSRVDSTWGVKPGNDVERSPFVSLFPVMSPIPQ